MFCHIGLHNMLTVFRIQLKMRKEKSSGRKVLENRRDLDTKDKSRMVYWHLESPFIQPWCPVENKLTWISKFRMGSLFVLCQSRVLGWWQHSSHLYFFRREKFKALHWFRRVGRFNGESNPESENKKFCFQEFGTHVLFFLSDVEFRKQN